MGLLNELMEHPDEILPLLKLKMAANRAKKLPKDKALAFCYEILNNVSRSFAIVIQQLPDELRDSVCIFYLVLRALDTIEDDMSIPQAEKLPQLLSFYEKTTDRGYTSDCGEGEYKRLMKNYPLVVDAFLNLKPVYQEVIIDITKRMGEGMAEFIPKEVMSIKEYETYCYYVAGLVGVGLSQLYAKSGLESEVMLQYNCKGTLADSMGQFLQQTNIIRDYLEDINELPAPRMFWPREIWSRYAPSGELEDFKDPAHEMEALQCLNHMISNALLHVPACLEYMKLCKDPKVFAFTAIPQVMAIATLALCYNNHKVFTGVVKIRKGLAAKLTVSTRSMTDVYTIFREFSLELVSKVRPNENPNSAQATMTAVAEIERICTLGLKEEGATEKTEDSLSPQADEPIDLGTRILLWLMFFGYFCYAWKLFGLRESLGVATPETYNRIDIMQMVVSLAAMAFITKLCITGRKV